MTVHYLPDDEVRILIWNGYPGTKGYNGPDYPIAPVGGPPKRPPESVDEMQPRSGRSKESSND